jgi:uncharacterized protein YwgA
VSFNLKNTVVMESLKIERINDIIAFVLSIMGGEVQSKTKLIKTLYLIDIVFARKYNKVFSGIIYKSSYYGPYSEDIEESIESLKNRGYISIQKVFDSEGNGHYKVKLNSYPFLGYLKEEEKYQLKDIVLPLARMDLNKIVNISDSTKEYQTTDFNHTIQLVAH